jgi:hypothetical protein
MTLSAAPSHYAMERVEPLPEYHLKVFFKNGEVRVADIWAMRGSNPLFKEAFEKFDQVQFSPFDVYWEVGDNTVEIEAQDLWGEGMLVPDKAAQTAQEAELGTFSWRPRLSRTPWRGHAMRESLKA